MITHFTMNSATQPDVPTAERCQGTPTLTVVDNRGLTVRTVRYNRTAAEAPLDELITRQTVSVLGHLTSSIDPRLFDEQQLDPGVKPNFQYLHTLSGRIIKTHSQDAGEQTVLYDCEGGMVWQDNSRDIQQRCSYDLLHRPTAYYEQTATNPEQVSERWFYGEALSDPAANCRGRLFRHYSPAGLTVTPAYSITGQVLTSEQQFLKDEVLSSHWPEDDPASWDEELTPEIYTSAWDYNALGMQSQRTDARGNRQQQRLNITGQLAESTLLLSGESTPQPVLRTITYNAAGQPLYEEAGNGVITEYAYEPQTLRLASLTTSRPEQTGRGSLLQALTYQYDPVGNLLSISDGAEPTRFGHNQRVNAASLYSYDALYQLYQASGRENANATQQTQALPPAIVPLWQEATELTNYTRTYSYDRGGNLTAIQHSGLNPYTQQMVVASDSNKAMQQAPGLTPGDVDSFFDACGNLRELAAGQPLAWNSRNRLQRSTQVVRSGPDDDSEVYWYDGQGQRSCKLSTTLTSGTIRKARVYYLPGLELRQTEQVQNGTTTVTESLQVLSAGTAGRQSLRVLHWEQGQPAAIENDQYRYSLDDQIGSSLLELDRQADILTWEEYFPFGGTAVWSARSESEAKYKYVRYSGQERDGTGLYYYGFRYYAPWLARWLNPDPAGTVDGLNLFCMVGNNPISRKDHFGLNARKGSAYYSHVYRPTTEPITETRSRFNYTDIKGKLSKIGTSILSGLKSMGALLWKGLKSISSHFRRSTVSQYTPLHEEEKLTSHGPIYKPNSFSYRGNLTIPFTSTIPFSNSRHDFEADINRGNYVIRNTITNINTRITPSDKHNSSHLERAEAVIGDGKAHDFIVNFANQSLGNQLIKPIRTALNRQYLGSGNSNSTYEINIGRNKENEAVTINYIYSMHFSNILIFDTNTTGTILGFEGDLTAEYSITLNPDEPRNPIVSGTNDRTPYGTFRLTIS